MGLGTHAQLELSKSSLLPMALILFFLWKLTWKDFEMTYWRNFAGLTNMVAVRCANEGRRRACSLCLLWNNSIIVDFQAIHMCFIDMLVSTSNKLFTSEIIKDMDRVAHNPKWLLLGKNLEEIPLMPTWLRILGSPFRAATSQTYYGTNVKFLLGLVTNMTHIKARLNKFTASSEWISKFPRVVVSHLLRYTSYHSPILLNLSSNISCRSNMRHIHRFEQV